MDSRGIDKMDELPVADTPEDVAVLYSWANLHGAKYRDFSASRREYRAQLRHRAAEQVREQELKAQAEAEAAAAAADAAARNAASSAQSMVDKPADSSRQQALREAGRASRIASAERVEAARRAEAAALAEVAARREEREIAEAQASARKQAARYAESEIRSRDNVSRATAQVPGQISDPYTPHGQGAPQQFNERPSERPVVRSNSTPQSVRLDTPYPPVHEVYVPEPVQPPAVVSSSSSGRRPRGYRPDDASGVRQIYRDPEFEAQQAEFVAAEPVRPLPPPRPRPSTEPPLDPRFAPISVYPAAVKSPEYADQTVPALPQKLAAANAAIQGFVPAGYEAQTPQPMRAAHFDSSLQIQRPAGWQGGSPDRTEAPIEARPVDTRQIASRATQALPDSPISSHRSPVAPRPATQYQPGNLRQPSPQSLPQEASRARRGQDDLSFQPTPYYPEASQRQTQPATNLDTTSSYKSSYTTEPTGPAWLYAPQTPASAVPPPRNVSPVSSPAQSSVADTLQHSRERVAARWYALKGVFEQPGQEQPEVPIRQKEIRTPVLAVFSLAGGVGKTSLVATLGRSLSSMGEKVLLTDTTSHGLLPFYFGASELRQGVVRTFSPPSGSTDAPIYLVSYDVDQKGNDEESQAQLVDEITQNSKGTHRLLLDLTPSSGWIARRMARMNPTILVPVAPDMNSVISLQSVEKYFHGSIDADGRPLQPYYVLNQFDASLPLHLDVREVLRRQLGDRLLPFVIRRAPSVSESLAEGMTVVDYAPDEPVAEDYQNVASWLRTIAAPATAGFRNVRWSER